MEVNVLDYTDNLIVTDEELANLLELYYAEPILFSEQILNVFPDDQQKEVIESLYEYHKATVKSGRGCGKTYVAAIIILHFLCTRYFAQVYLSAPAGGTLAGAIWPTLAKIYDGMNSMYKDQFEFLSTTIKHREHPHTWFCIQRTSRAETPDSLAGAHAKNMLYVVDEASGVDDKVFRVIFGSLTEENNYLLMLSNPRRLTGFFANSFKPNNKKVFKQLTMTALDSAWVTKQSIQHWKNLYGEDSNIYRVEVLGKFPHSEDEAILPWNLVNDAIEREIPEDDYKDVDVYWGLDVGVANDKSVLIKRQGPKVFNDIKKWRNKDTMEVVGLVMNEWQKTPEEMRPTKIFVDSIGIGRGPYDRLKEQGLPVLKAVASERATDRKYISNNKSEWWKAMYEWFKDEQPDIPNDNELLEQLTTYRARTSSDNRFMTEKKDEYKRRHKNSPDSADALSITFNKKSKKHVGLTT